VQYQIGTLGGGVLGLTALGSSVVTLDARADGYGWFVDPGLPSDTTFEDVVAPQELQAGPGSPAFGRMDLLTVVEHELGHVLGLSDLDPQTVPHDLLTETLAPGVRRLPTPSVEMPDTTTVLTPDAQLALLTRPVMVAAPNLRKPSPAIFISLSADHQDVTHAFAVARVTAALPPAMENLRAVPADGNYADAALDAFFAQFGNKKGFLLRAARRH
jgi:hypothetical protein